MNDVNFQDTEQSQAVEILKTALQLSASFPTIIIAKKKGQCTRELQPTALHMESSRTSWLGFREAPWETVLSVSPWHSGVGVMGRQEGPTLSQLADSITQTAALLVPRFST